MWKTICRATFLLFLLVLAFLAWILLTQTGTRWTLQQASARFDSLTLSGIDGRLIDNLEIASVYYQSGVTEISTENFHGEWSVNSLLKRSFVIDDLQLKSLTIKLSQDLEPTEKTATPFSFPSLPLAIYLENADIENFTFIQSEVTHTLNDIALSISANESSIVVKNAELSWQENHAALAAVIELNDDYPISADLNVEIPTLLGEKGSHLSLAANGEIAGDVSIHSLLTGHQSAELKAHIRPLSKPLQLSGTLTAELLQTLESDDQSPKLQDLQLDFSGDLDLIEVESKTVVSANQVPSNQLSASGQIESLARLENMEIVLETLGGAVELAGDFAWKDQLRWSIDGTFKNIDISQYREDINSTIAGSFSSQGEQTAGEIISPTTKINLRGSLQDRPLIADIDIRLAENATVDINKLSLRSGENYLNAQGSIDQQLNIDAVLSAPNLANLWPDLSGSMSGEIKASGDRTRPTLDAKLVGEAIALGEFSVDKLDIQTNIVEGGTNESSLMLKTSGINGSSLSDGSLDAYLEGSLSKHKLSLSANTSDQNAKLLFSGKLSDTDWIGSLETAQLSYQDLDFSLQAPTAINWQNDLAQLAVSAHCWLHESATICLQKDTKLHADEGEAKLALSNVNLSGFNTWLPENTRASGLLQADIDGSWTQDSSLLFSLKTEVQELSLQTKDPDGRDFSIHFNQAELRADFDENTGEFSLLMNSPQQGRTEINASISPSTKNLTGDVDIEGFQLKPLQALLPQLDELKGEINVKGTLSGELTDPNFKGQVVLNSPALAGASMPLTIDGGDLIVDVDGRKAKLKASLKTTPTGSLDINGDILYQDSLRADMNVVGKQLAVILPPTVDATINHDITVALHQDKLTVRGDVNIPDATIVLEGIKRSGPSLSKDLVFTDLEDQNESDAVADSPLQTDLDIEVQLDDDVHMSGYGFDTHLFGDIKIRQRANQPVQLAGELALKDGSYHAYGQDLTVRRGELLFVGPIQSTRLDVEAYRTIDAVEAGLVLEGTLLAPVTTLYSNPTMSDSEVLSYIVLGGPPGQGGDTSAILARAALNLGLKNGNRIAGQFASAAGIKDFNIGADGKGENTGVILSGRLSPKLLLSYRYGIFDTVDTLTARYDLNQELYLELMRGVDQAIDLFYTFDY